MNEEIFLRHSQQQLLLQQQQQLLLLGCRSYDFPATSKEKKKTILGSKSKEKPLALKTPGVPAS